VLTDGHSYKILPEAKDYKRIGEGDTGLNTGGMGAISPVPFADSAFMNKVEERIIKPTINGLKAEGISYTGFIFIGLMSVNGEPYVIEYNCRMGDPETEVVLPRITSDFASLMLATGEGKLNETTLEITAQHAATIMLVSGGYPGEYEKGKIITGTEAVKSGLVFHAGTARNGQGQLVTKGGRVIAVTSLASNLEDALLQCKQNAYGISFEGKYYRSDIGYEFLKN
jgi:phosphoribosylamine--glycine ligase